MSVAQRQAPKSRKPITCKHRNDADLCTADECNVRRELLNDPASSKTVATIGYCWVHDRHYCVDCDGRCVECPTGQPSSGGAVDGAGENRQ